MFDRANVGDVVIFIPTDIRSTKAQATKIVQRNGSFIAVMGVACDEKLVQFHPEEGTAYNGSGYLMLNSVEAQTLLSLINLVYDLYWQGRRDHGQT